ncbi:E3 ubiquitin-protein ligase rnf8 [Paramarasmius palmivorus]|uniref:E3 ubiquitin-protein ligase rnf8 n=1 Tax=Paramarasmius palmivorus TaxID=297713 RepID=A0AAW0BBI8_9AGAR
MEHESRFLSGAVEPRLEQDNPTLVIERLEKEVTELRENLERYQKQDSKMEHKISRLRGVRRYQQESITSSDIAYYKTKLELQRQLERTEAKRKKVANMLIACMQENTKLKNARIPIAKVKEAVQCEICYEPMSQAVMIQGCGHSFCSGCLEKWRRKQPECPSCRKPIKTEPQKNYTLQAVEELIGESEIIVL